MTRDNNWFFSSYYYIIIILFYRVRHAAAERRRHGQTQTVRPNGSDACTSKRRHCRFNRPVNILYTRSVVSRIQYIHPDTTRVAVAPGQQTSRNDRFLRLSDVLRARIVFSVVARRLRCRALRYVISSLSSSTPFAFPFQSNII